MLGQSTATPAQATSSSAKGGYVEGAQSLLAHLKASSSLPAPAKTPVPAAEATPAPAVAAMALAIGTEEERKSAEDLFPAARQASVHKAWRKVAGSLKALHRELSYGSREVDDDRGMVGEAYRLAIQASRRDSGASAQVAAHTAIETIAKSFVTDGTYARLAIGPYGIAEISRLVGDLQHMARGINGSVGIAYPAISGVFTSMREAAAAQRAIQTTWDVAVARRDQLVAEYNEPSTHQHGTPPEAQRDAMVAAEAAVYTTPAPDFSAVLRKIIDSAIIKEGLALDTPAEDVIAWLGASGDHADLCQASIYRDIQRLAVASPAYARDRTEWEAAMARVSAALDHEHTTSIAWDEAYAQGVTLHQEHPINAAWEDADTGVGVAIDALLDVTPPDAAALAEQIRAFGWLEHETRSDIAGGSGWALDMAASPIADAIDAGSEDLVCTRLLALYRHALTLGGRQVGSPGPGYFRGHAAKFASAASFAIAAE